MKRKLNRQYFVNHKSRMCQILQGRDELHNAQVAEALRSGFVEVTGDEQDAFRAETMRARDAGWNPDGRIGYTKFMANLAAKFLEKSRGEFEEAFNKRLAKSGFVARLDRLPDGRYEYIDASSAWWAWQESRTTLVIKLPDALDSDRGWVIDRDEARDAIEAAGLKVVS